MRIGVLGGTGPAGQGIAVRMADAGHEVIVGSRDRERAAALVDALGERWGDRVRTLEPGDNAQAAEADLVVLATVWDAAVDTAALHAEALAGKTLISMANGLERGLREVRPRLPPEGSISAAVQKVAPAARVVAAFHLIPAAELANLDHELHSDVLVAGDDDDARATVMNLVETMGLLRAFDAGSLANALGIEAFTAALITVNIRHKGQAHIHLEGVEPRSSTRAR
ncbi:MAG: NADPH-dependent F420 reductase [Acidimicrobiia bacterium]